MEKEQVRESRLAFLGGGWVLVVVKLLLVAKTQRLEEGSKKSRNDYLWERTGGRLQVP